MASQIEPRDLLSMWVHTRDWDLQAPESFLCCDERGAGSWQGLHAAIRGRRKKQGNEVQSPFNTMAMALAFYCCDKEQWWRHLVWYSPFRELEHLIIMPKSTAAASKHELTSWDTTVKHTELTGNGVGSWDLKAHSQQHTFSNKVPPLNPSQKRFPNWRPNS